MRITGTLEPVGDLTIVWADGVFTADPTGLVAPMIDAGTPVTPTPTGPWFKAAAEPAALALLTARAAFDAVLTEKDADEAYAELEGICAVPDGSSA